MNGEDFNTELVFGKDPAATPGVNGSYPLICHSLDTILTAEYAWDHWLRPGLRKKLIEVLGGDESLARRAYLLGAGLHDIGKANPFFQFQERLGATDYSATLAAATQLPRTSDSLRGLLRQFPGHPLRRHEFLTHRAISGRWADSGDRLDGARSGQTGGAGADWLAVVAGGHHGFWRDPFHNATSVASAGEAMRAGGWSDVQELVMQQVCAAVGLTLDEVPPLRGDSPGLTVACLTGLLTLADWLASDNAIVTRGKSDFSSLESGKLPTVVHPGSWLAARRPPLHRHARRCLGRLAPAPSEEFQAAVMGALRPRPLQREAMSLADDRGLWIAMYPTGDGKTKAALLRSALDLREGFLFGMPTMATTDAMERTLTRIGQALGSNGFELIKSHSLARLQPGEAPPKPRDDSDDECCDQGNISWYTTSNRKLVAPYVVATCDQVLTGALAARQLCFRLTGLANRHVILDEIHTYDPYQTELLVELLEWWGATGTRVTLLSATLPTKHLQLMSRAYRRGATGGADRLPEQLPEAGFPATVFVSASPGCPVTSAYLVRRPAETVASPPVTVVNLEMVESVAARVEAHIHWAVETVRQHPDSPIAIVVNTVGDCIEIAYSLASNPVVTDTHEVVCLHSGLLHGHRQAVAQHLEVRLGQDAQTRGFDHRDAGRRPVLVVGTQAIQASLDFDVDFLSTHLAPAPDLLQRMGRAWRFDAPARRTRLTESTRRVHVVSVGDTTNGEIVSPTGSLPYLTAVLRRTHAALRSHVSTNDGRLDVMGFSQTWVDIAYDADPGALLDEDVSIQAEAAREIIETSARRSAADASKALLNTSEGLLSQARRGRPGVTWGQLVNLTHRPDDEDLMRTRHIDLEPMRVLVVDSSRKGAYWDPLREALVPIHGHPGVEALESGSQEPDWLICHQLAVPWNWRRSVALAVDKTLGGRVWSPTRASLRSTRPLDLKELVDLRYHPVLGLVPAGEMDSE